MARKTSHPPPDALLSRLPPEQAALCGVVMDAMVQVEPALVARAYMGWGCIGLRHPEAGYVCGIFPMETGAVRVGFELGILLSDAEGLLTEGGRQFRAHDLRVGGALPLKGLLALLAEAVRLGRDRRR